MTHDKGLMAPAQASINFIVAAQDPVGGGWRYQVKQAGDTSVVGWQLMALKSAHMAYLNVPPETIREAGGSDGKSSAIARPAEISRVVAHRNDLRILIIGVAFLGEPIVVFNC